MNTGKKKILVIDNNKSSLGLLLRTLKASSYLAECSFITVDNAHAAIQTIPLEHPNVVLCHRNTPGISLSQLAEVMESCGIPSRSLIAVTTIVSPILETSLYEKYGIAAFIQPHEDTQLVNYLIEILDSTNKPQAKVLTRAAASDGTFTAQTMATVLIDLQENRATGKLTITNQNTRKVIDIVIGNPTHAISNRRQERFGTYLRDIGTISQTECRIAMQHATSQNIRLGESFIALGFLEPEEVDTALTHHTKYCIAESLRWTEGTWQFVPGPIEDLSRITSPLSPLELIVHGLKNSYYAPDVASYLAEENHLSQVRLNDRGARLWNSIRDTLCPSAPACSSDRTLILKELVSSFPSTFDLGRMLDILLQTKSCTIVGIPSSTPLAAPSFAEIASASLPSLSEKPEQSWIEQLKEEPTFRTLSTDEYENEASGYVEIDTLVAQGKHQQRIGTSKRKLLTEYIRIQQRNLYEVLQVEPEATKGAIQSAVTTLRKDFALAQYIFFDLGEDIHKLSEIHEKYNRCERILLDADTRKTYDINLQATHNKKLQRLAIQKQNNLFRAEGHYQHACDRLEKGDLPTAIRALKDAVTLAPNEPDYVADYAWAQYIEGGHSATFTAKAKSMLNNCLSWDLEHAKAHEYLGQIYSQEKDNIELSVHHLGVAIDRNPACDAALQTLESIWHQQNKPLRLERQYRRILYRLAGKNSAAQIKVWFRLAKLYRDTLQDLPRARLALLQAARIHPSSLEIKAALQAIDLPQSAPFFASIQDERQQWNQEHWRPEIADTLIQRAIRAGHEDYAFSIASLSVASEVPCAAAEKYYHQNKRQYLVRAQRSISHSTWAMMRHNDDVPALNALYELVAPAVFESAQTRLSDHNLDMTMEVPLQELPKRFRTVMSYACHQLSVAVPPIFINPPLREQMGIIALQKPIFVAGDEALRCPNDALLAFRITRALSYLSPGRLIGSSMQGRFLKAIFLSLFPENISLLPKANTKTVPAPTHSLPVRALRQKIMSLPSSSLAQASKIANKLITNNTSLNLSRWKQGIDHTANRVATVLSGDIPTVWTATNTTPSLQKDLLSFCSSQSYFEVRKQIGISIKVT